MTEPEPQEPPAPTTPAPQPAVPSLRQPAFWLALLALLAVLLLAWSGSSRDAALREEVAQRLGAAETAQRDAQATARQNREALDALQAKVGALEAQLAEMQSQQLALDTIYQELSRGRDDRLLAEVEQDVTIAAQQLQLAGNVGAALIALSDAEERLARSAQPRFLGLRKLIARDIERLQAMPTADVPGIALRLDAVINALPNLPLAFEHRPPAEKPAKADKGADAAKSAAPTLAEMLRTWGAELWHEVRQLVRIERLDRPDPGLLAPREAFFLRENLRLRLLAARLALLARDGRSFQSDLRQAGEWLGNYFDSRAPAVQEARETLKSLERLDVMREPAELNETLAALRNLKMSRDRGAAKQ